MYEAVGDNTNGGKNTSNGNIPLLVLSPATVNYTGYRNKF